MFKAIANMFGCSNQFNILDAGFKADPKLAELTERAKRNMEAWGRTPVLEGGSYHPVNRALNAVKMKELKRVKSPKSPKRVM